MTRRRRRATAPETAAPRRRRASAVEESLETLGVTVGGAVQSTGIGAHFLHLTTYQNWPSFPWEAGDGPFTGTAGHHHDGTSTASFRTDWDADTLARLQKIADGSSGTTEPDQPVWWIVFQMSWWAPQWITGGLLVGILIPFRLLDIVGEDNKTDALALITVLNTVVNLCGPLFGGASDAMPYTRLGRRRPFIMTGMLGVATSIYIMCYAHTYVMFFMGWALFCVGNNCAQPAYSCLLPELVPNQQRGLASGIFVFFQVFGALISSGLGLLVGQGTISDDGAYWVLIALAVYSSVAGCIGMGRHPGIWSPERPPLDEEKHDEQHADADKRKVPKANGSEAESQLIQSDPVLAPIPASLRKLLSFFTAFGSGNFRWLFIYIFIWSSSGQFGNLFKAYWMADVIGPDFDFFGYEIAKCSVVPSDEFESCTSSGAQSALSIMNGMNQLMSMVTAVLGGWLGDRYGKRAVLTAVFLILWQPIVWMAFTTSFTTVAVLNIYCGLFGGMLGGPINGLMADVLPTGSDGKPTHPTRDWNLICQAWSLPGIVFPMILGSAFAWPIFPNKRAVYSSFFLINAFCNIIQIPCLACLSDVSDDGQARRGAYVDGRLAQYSAPLGARLCDLLLWRRVIDELESPLGEKQDSENGQGVPDDDGEAAAVLFQTVLAAKRENVQSRNNLASTASFRSNELD